MLEIILADLRDRFGDKVLLSPEDLASVINKSVGQQANERSQGKFPIPHKVEGRRVKVTIYDLAEHLANLGKTQVKQDLARIPDKLTRTQKKSTKGLLEKNWWLFHCSAIYAAIDRSILEFELPSSPTQKKNTNKI